MDPVAINNLLQDLNSMWALVNISIDSCGDRPSLLGIRSLTAAMRLKLELLRGGEPQQSPLTKGETGGCKV